MRLKSDIRSLREIVAVLVLPVILGVAGARAGEQQGEKTVEQLRKNIQVLKGLPASELNPVMDFASTSLGVRCQHCHVSDTTGWKFESDDKPAKRTARKMMQMVMDLNTKDFGGRTAVSCFTCHRGIAEPAATMPLPQQPAPSVGPGEEKAAVPVLPGLAEVLDRYENSLGGADALRKITTRVLEGVAVDLQGREMPMEIVQQGPDKFALTITLREGARSSRCFNGTAGWMSTPRGVREIPPPELEDLRRDAPLFPLSRMRSLAERMHVKDKDTINGTVAYVLEASVGEHETERYYVDSANGLLLRRTVMIETMIGDIPAQVDYGDYRSVDGVKIPFMVREATVDPRDSRTIRVSSVKQNGPIDEKQWVMPESKARGR